MSFGERVKEALITRAAEGLAVSVSVILIWVCSQVGPIILPVLESTLPKALLVNSLLASLGLNIVVLILFWFLRKKTEFKLKYGIYWDKEKNPHCPNCKIPIGGYGEYHTGGKGYYCKPCGKIFPLTDAAGNHIDPAQAVSEL